MAGKPAGDPSTALRMTKSGKKKTKEPAMEQVKKAPRRQLTTAEWRKIRLEYVKGKTTYAKLAEKYGTSAGNIRKRASKEGWTKRKRKLDTEVEQKTLERRCDARAREFSKLAEVNDQMADILDNLMRFIAQQPSTLTADLRGVESLTKAICQVVQTKRDLYNLPNELDRAKIEGIREKNRLERQKYEAEMAEKAAMKSEAENTMIRVVIDSSDGEELVLDE